MHVNAPKAASIGFVLALVLAATPTAAASETASAQRLTLADAVARAIDHSPRVAAASAQTEAANQRFEATRAGRFPRFWINANTTQFQEPMVVTPIHGFTPGLFPEFDDTIAQATLAVEQSIWDGGRRQSRERQTSLEATLAEIGESASSQSIALQTSAIYLDILTARETLEAQDTRLRSLREEIDRVHKFQDVGKAAEIESLRVEAAIAAAESERTILVARLDASERSLARITGLDPAATRARNLRAASLDASVTSRAAIESAAMGGNPSIRGARTAALAADAGISVARSAYFPDIVLTASVNEFGSPDVSFVSEWQAGVRVRVPLWDSGVTAARVAAATASSRAAERDADQVELDVRNRVDTALAQIAGAASSVSSLEKAVERFEEVARIERLRLDLGAGTQTDYLRAEADLAQSRAALSSARYRYVFAQIELASITGEIGAEWIETNVRNES